jgi:hypothetical protein
VGFTGERVLRTVRAPRLPTWKEMYPHRPTRLLMMELHRLGYEVASMVDNRGYFRTGKGKILILVLSECADFEITHVVLGRCTMTPWQALLWARGQAR